MTVSFKEDKNADRPINSARPLRVVCVGAGISGILIGIELPKLIPNLELIILDKNEEIGGTWFENRYPGVACDVPAHAYQLSFESNPAWSHYYATGAEILRYWRAVAAKYGIDQYLRLGREVREARWHDGVRQWLVEVHNKFSGRAELIAADVLIMAEGELNRWSWPDIEGLKDFKGSLVHSAAWPESFDHKGKRVAVIGAGSTGIQIVPAMQPDVAQLYHYIRGRNWVSPRFSDGQLRARAGDAENCAFSRDEVKQWLNDPELYLDFRKAIEQETQADFRLAFSNTPLQHATTARLEKVMRERLAARPELADRLIPSFPPLCKRLTPGPGFLESLSAPNVEPVFDPITRVVPKGIVTEDGTLREVDAIVCATGFDTDFRHRLPVFGAGGRSLRDKWADFPSSYLGVTVDEFPNFFVMLGPNSTQGAGSLLIQLEHSARYVAQCVKKLSVGNVETMTPKPAAVEKFVQFGEKWFRNTVFGADCSSWYKSGPQGRVAALWPGSSLHCIEALKTPRFEDFDYTYVDNDEFGWFGNGFSEKDLDQDADKSYYITPNMIDVERLLLKAE